MTKKYVVARRQRAAAKAVERRWRQQAIEESMDRPIKADKWEGMYKKPTLVVRHIRSA
jgi:hypothetical protein